MQSHLVKGSGRGRLDIQGTGSKLVQLLESQQSAESLRRGEAAC